MLTGALQPPPSVACPRPPVAKCPDPASIPRDNGADECVFRNCITLFAKEPSPGPVAQPRALLVSNIFQNDSGKE